MWKLGTEGYVIYALLERFEELEDAVEKSFLDMDEALSFLRSRPDFRSPLRRYLAERHEEADAAAAGDRDLQLVARWLVERRLRLVSFTVDLAGAGVSISPEQQPSEAVPREPKPPPHRSWIEVVLVDEEDQPVPYEPFEILSGDGALVVARGVVNQDGFARVLLDEAGAYHVRFTSLDKGAWDHG